MSLMAWIVPRKPTLTSITVGTVSWIAAFATAWALWPAAPLTTDRIGYGVQMLAPVSVLVLLMVAACFRLFERPEAENPLNGVESDAFKVHQRVLSNTIEQFVIFAPALLALAVRVDAGHLRIVPILATLWCAGRVLFWVGYRIKSVFRGPGFEWTLFSSVVAIGWYFSLVFATH